MSMIFAYDVNALLTLINQNLSANGGAETETPMVESVMSATLERGLGLSVYLVEKTLKFDHTIPSSKGLGLALGRSRDNLIVRMKKQR